MPTGIPGFDQLLDGGLPRGRTTLLMGGPGCGKTLFALQSLVNGAREWDEPGIFVAFEERAEQIVADAAGMGWNLPALRDRKLCFLDAHLPESVILGGEFDLGGLLAVLDAKIAELGARRVVFDGIDMLLGVLDAPAVERREIFRLSEWIHRQRLSGIVTCKTDVGGDLPRQHEAYLPYLADCVVTLHQQPSTSVLGRRLRVTKCRGIGHTGSEVPFTITSRGLQVASYPPIDPTVLVSSARVSTGIERLDTMIRGGYFQGSSVLISGAPGTAKSTLAACFAERAAARGEPTLYISFDENPQEIVRNVRSVGINLEPHVRNGRLTVAAARKADRSSEEHVAWIGGMVASGKVRNLVIDPASALATPATEMAGGEAVVRIISIAKSLGITLVMTSLTEKSAPEMENSASTVSTIADTWIHVSYVILAGERNRALTIIKSRGTGHSNQVRELVLSDRGVDLTDVYLAGGEVLMGTMRWQKELEEKNANSQAGERLSQAQREAELAAAEARARLAALQLEVASREAAVETLRAERVARREAFESRQDSMRRLRTADAVEAKKRSERHRQGGSGEVSR